MFQIVVIIIRRGLNQRFKGETVSKNLALLQKRPGPGDFEEILRHGRKGRRSEVLRQIFRLETTERKNCMTLRRRSRSAIKCRMAVCRLRRHCVKISQ